LPNRYLLPEIRSFWSSIRVAHSAKLQLRLTLSWFDCFCSL